jgi:putative flippase GtrA
VIVRWLRFNLVGLAGVAVQLGALALYARVFGIHYLVATALAVETAVLHNYFWHARWTWRGRGGSIWRFHLANGLVSIVANLLLMRWLAGGLGLPLMVANLLSIAGASVVNFAAGEFFVFAEQPFTASIRSRLLALRK